MSDERQRTHWDGCWRDRAHHECALSRLAAVEAERDALRAERDELANNTPGDWYAQARQAREMVAGLHQEAREWRARAEQAEAELERARKDAERLAMVMCNEAVRRALMIEYDTFSTHPGDIFAAVDAAIAKGTEPCRQGCST